MTTMEIRLERVDRIYRTGEKVRGVVVISRSGSMSHSGITMKVEGVIKLQLSARSVGLFEAFYSSIKPMVLLDYEIDVASPGRVPDGVTEFPFEFDMDPVVGQNKLYETYHGVYVNCTYTISVECVRGMLKNNLLADLEFIVECPDTGDNPPEPVPFDITPGTLENVKRSSLKNIPHFRITGKLHRTNCQVSFFFYKSLLYTMLVIIFSATRIIIILTCNVYIYIYYIFQKYNYNIGTCSIHWSNYY